MPVTVRPHLGRRELRHRPPPERLADHRGPLDRRRARPASRRSRRAVSSAWIVGGIGRRERSPATRHRPSSAAGRPSSTSMRSISSTKSGLPSATPRSVLVPRGRAPVRREVLDQPVASRGRVSGCSETSSGVLGAVQPGRESSSSGRARQSDEHRGVADPVGEVLEQVEERRFGPMDVVEDDDQRASRREVLEAACAPPRRSPGRPASRGRGRAAPRGARGPARRRPLAGAGAEIFAPGLVGRIPLGDPGGVLEHGDDRPERDALAVGQAAALEHRRARRRAARGARPSAATCPRRRSPSR